MGKWSLQVSGAAAVQVSLQRDGDRLRVQVEDQAFDALGEFTPDGEGLLRIGNAAHRFYAARVGEELHLWLDGETYRFLLPETRARVRRGESASASGELKSPMPGQVLKVLAQPGDRVTEHAPLVVIESMKMELTVTAPAEGTVAEVRCEPGQMVQMGAVLVRLEPVP
jgi:acetyl/propionyl-CoA carboxylase alpha subunit